MNESAAYAGEGAVPGSRASQFLSPEAQARVLATPRAKAMTTPKQAGKMAASIVPRSLPSKDASVIPCTPAGAYEEVSQSGKSMPCTPLEGENCCLR